jgi:L-threonylcarbamoyladenylate synthase
MTESFETDVLSSLEVLRSGGVVLCPTETFWAFCCDATSETAVEKIFRITQSQDAEPVTVLMADEREVLQYVANPDLSVFDFLEEQSLPTKVIFEGALGLPDNVVTGNGSIAIRIVQDEFCRHLVKRLRRPLASIPANSIGHDTPTSFLQVSKEICAHADYVVRWQDDLTVAPAYQTIRWRNGKAEYLSK